ncbi:hypothetical protein [Streptomyces sp. NPDC052225]|uniref:hypothetical protein n=1 Tax=Streptomyces sp. NPDC052225 TaxID=3154949 RepID=UPI003446A220
MVLMKHPTLPDQNITVHEISVPSYERAGWQVVEDQPVEATAAQGRRREKGD